MQRTWVIAVAVIAGMMNSGCIFGSRGPAHHAEAHDAPAWKVSWFTSCQGGASDYCVGKFGFSVSANRSFVVGPGPEGQIETGILEEQDFRAVEERVNEVLEGWSGTHTENCLSSEESSEVAFRGKVLLAKNQQDWQVLTGGVERVCFQTAKAEPALRLQDAIQGVATKYYVTPFPDHCAESASRVHALYPDLQGCSVDADCSYFSWDLEPVPSAPAQFVVTDSCSRIRPLAVANTSAVAASKEKLKALIQSVEESCGARITREGCTGIRGFDSSDGEAKCLKENGRGVCRVNPAAAP